MELNRRSFFKGLATTLGFCAIGQIPRIGGPLATTERIVVPCDCHDPLRCNSLTRCTVNHLTPDELETLFAIRTPYEEPLIGILDDLSVLRYRHHGLYELFHG